MGRLIAYISVLAISAFCVDGSDYGTGCYDCNYAPSGYVKGFKYWTEGSAEVGYMRCALISPADPIHLRRTLCRTGRCFIRQEGNGLVYRGCADPENLPLDVDPEVNCTYQGPNKSLWWFCEGAYCNKGQLGESEGTCASPPPVTKDETTTAAYVSEPQNDPTNYHEPAEYKDKHGIHGEVAAYENHASYNGHDNYENYGRYNDLHRNYGGWYGGYGGYNRYNGYPGRYARYNNYGGPRNLHGIRGNYGRYGYNKGNNHHGALSWYPQEGPQYNEHPTHVVDEVDEYTESAPVTETAIVQKDYNPCDGTCHYNPSGLFADPARSNHFIQCGCAFTENRPCTCCKKFYLPCAPGSYFDDHKKVCVDKQN